MAPMSTRWRWRLVALPLLTGCELVTDVFDRPVEPIHVDQCVDAVNPSDGFVREGNGYLYRSEAVIDECGVYSGQVRFFEEAGEWRVEVSQRYCNGCNVPMKYLSSGPAGNGPRLIDEPGSVPDSIPLLLVSDGRNTPYPCNCRYPNVSIASEPVTFVLTRTFVESGESLEGALVRSLSYLHHGHRPYPAPAGYWDDPVDYADELRVQFFWPRLHLTSDRDDVGGAVSWGGTCAAYGIEVFAPYLPRSLEAPRVFATSAPVPDEIAEALRQL